MKSYHQRINLKVRERKIYLPGNEFLLPDHTPYEVVVDFDGEWSEDPKCAVLRLQREEVDFIKNVPFTGNCFTIEHPGNAAADGRMYMKIVCGDLETDECVIRLLSSMTCPNCGGIIVPDVGFFKPEVGKAYYGGRHE